MRVQNLVTAVLIISIGTLLTACQKNPLERLLHAAEMKHHQTPATPVTPATPATPATAVKSPLDKKDLGVLPLSNRVPITISLGKNKKCTITPTLLESGKLQIILAVTTTGADGRPQGMNAARVLARPGEPFNLSIGDMNLSFTPQLTDQ